MKPFKILSLAGLICSFSFLAPKVQAQCIQSDAFNDGASTGGLLGSFWAAPASINDNTAGQTQVEGLALTITAAGTGFPVGATDSFYYIYQPVTGDIDVDLQIDAVPAFANSKEGLMIRNGLNAGDVYAFVGINNQNTFLFRERNATNA